MHSITQYGEGGSPFDKIRKIDEDGREYWSARELMPFMGYIKWERFEDNLERAKAACENSGFSIADHFPGTGKMITVGKGGQRETTDYWLSRYGCYLVAMTGDSRKEQVALALTYFATKTREAELAAEARALPKDYKSALRQLLDEVERAEKLQEKVKALEPKAKFYDAVSVAINSQTVAEVAKLYGWGEYRFFEWLRQHGYLMSKGSDRNLPYQKWLESDLFTLVEKTYKHARSGEDVLYSRTLITGKGICYFHKQLSEEGIILPALNLDEVEAVAS
jgi:DNA-damage-inducible protein D